MENFGNSSHSRQESFSLQFYVFTVLDQMFESFLPSNKGKEKAEIFLRGK
jgi:hypothetical protein